MATAVKEKAGGAFRYRAQKRKSHIGRFFDHKQTVDIFRSGHGRDSDGGRLAKLRTALGWSRRQLAVVMNASERAIVNWAAGDPLSAVYASKLREIQSIYDELKQLLKPAGIGPWLLSDMEEFEGRTPADLISRGETGRLWASLFYLRSGMPD